MINTERFFYLLVAGVLGLFALNVGLVLFGPLLVDALNAGGQAVTAWLKAVANL